MVAFAGPDPIGILIGAKRPSATLVHRIAVHPDHRRQGHGRHLLASLGSKLAILGPPRIVAEVPEACKAACALFEVSGYAQEAVLTDYVWDPGGTDVPEAPGGLVIPVTLDDLTANGLLGEPDSPTCWERGAETLTARKEDIAGLAVASDERLEACILYIERGSGPEAEIVWLRSFVEDGGARLAWLLSHLSAQSDGSFRFPRVHPVEASTSPLETLGFRPAGARRLYAAQARSDQ